MKKLLLITALVLSAQNAFANHEDCKCHKERGKKHGEKMEEHFFSKFDSNKDEEISQDEWNNAHNEKFKEIDVNKDKKLSKKELDEHHKRMREKFAKEKGFKKSDKN